MLDLHDLGIENIKLHQEIKDLKRCIESLDSENKMIKQFLQNNIRAKIIEKIESEDIGLTQFTRSEINNIIIKTTRISVPDLVIRCGNEKRLLDMIDEICR